jgi:hypothetical protein
LRSQFCEFELDAHSVAVINTLVEPLFAGLLIAGRRLLLEEEMSRANLL